MALNTNATQSGNFCMKESTLFNPIVFLVKASQSRSVFSSFMCVYTLLNIHRVKFAITPIIILPNCGMIRVYFIDS